MIDLAISYLKPLVQTSVNTLAMQQRQGTVIEPRTVAVISTRAEGAGEILNIPFVRLFDGGEPETLEGVGMGKAGSYSEYVSQILTLECVCEGDSDDLAAGRANDLAFAVECCVNKYRVGLRSGQLARADLGGTGSSEKIVNWQPLSSPKPQLTGPGDDKTNPVWTAKKQVKLKLWITKNKQTQ